MHEGIDRKRIRKHLLVFSLAAPLLAVVTYFGIGQVCLGIFSILNKKNINALNYYFLIELSKCYIGYL